MSQLKELNIVFENCEICTVPRNMIGEFHIGGIHQNISRIAANSISKYYSADEIYIELFKDADVEYCTFGLENERTTVINRIAQYNDITQIDAIYEDGQTDCIWIDFCSDENDDTQNKNQKCYKSEFGNLYIVICENKAVFDIFNFDEVNDEEYINFKKEMYDIGIEPQYEQEFSMENLPKMYKHVYLTKNDANSNATALAMRIYDEDAGWKFIYAKRSDDIIPYPDTFKYPTKNIEEFINSKHGCIGFRTREILEKHPLPNTPPEENSIVYKYYIEAKNAIEDIQNTL